MADKFRFGIFRNFVQSANFGGFLLLVCVVGSLIMANTPMGESLQSLLNTKLGIDNHIVHLNYSISTWINDGLMAIFFLLVGLEIKREALDGALSTPQKAILPVLVAIGGAVIPALIYLLFNINAETKAGWGIPMATDIAFALAVVSLLSKRVPHSLKVFLAALAIADDLIAILVIALFYSTGVDFSYLALAALSLLVLVVMNRFNVQNPCWYLIPGLLIWYFMHHSGIHATLAGVLVAITIPVKTNKSTSPLERLEHALIKPVQLFILPVFAFSNTNISFHATMIEGLGSPLAIGIATGLILGKPMGILLTTFLCVKTGIAQLPANSNWLQILGLGLLAGIGFTMSIFISMLSFDKDVLVEQAKLSILISSILAGILGYLVLRFFSRKPQV